MAKAIATTIGWCDGKVRDADAELMLAFQKGEELAFQELVERHHARLIRLIGRFVGDAAEAEDLAQEVFLRIYRARRTYRPTAKFSTWTFRIAINVSLNALRARASRRDSISTEQLAPAHEDSRRAPRDPAPDAPLERSELERTVREAVAKLPARQQVAVVLSKYEGMSYANIARTLGTSTMAVKSLLARARENLKDRLLVCLRTGGAG